MGLSIAVTRLACARGASLRAQDPSRGRGVPLEFYHAVVRHGLTSEKQLEAMVRREP